MRAIPQRQPLFLGGSIGGVPSFDLNFARGDNAVTKYGFVFTRATSATYVNSTGLIATAASGELRYTYDPVTLSALGVLIEEARTNLTATSTGGSIGGGVTVATAQSGAPDGSSTVLVTTGNGAAATHYTWNGAGTATLSAATQYCMSLFVKAGTATRVQMMSASGTWGTSYANFSLVGAGSVLSNGATSAGIQQYANGWYRIWIVGTSAGAGAANVGTCLINSDTAARLPSFSGSDSAYDYSTWGAQIEAGAFPTSYIHTSGTAATRNADVLSLTGAADVVAPWFNKDAGTWLVERYGSPAAIASAVCVDDGAATNRILVRQDASRVPHFIVGSTADVAGSAVVAGSAFKTAAAYAANDVSVSIGGGAVSTDATVTLPAGMTTARIGSSSAGEYANGTISRIRYYNRRLPNATLQSLTA